MSEYPLLDRCRCPWGTIVFRGIDGTMFLPQQNKCSRGHSDLWKAAKKLAAMRTSKVREVVNAVVPGDEAKTLFREEFNGPLFFRHLEI